MARSTARSSRRIPKTKKPRGRSTRPEWSAKFERLLSNRQRSQIFVEINIIMGDDASPIQVGKELAQKHTQYNAAMWTAYYQEWKRHHGKPPGYGSENQVEPWISDEVFNELVDAEIDLWGKNKTNMGFVSRKLVEKYGVYSEGSWKRHGQNRLNGAPAPGRAAATVRHGTQATPSPVLTSSSVLSTATTPKTSKPKPILTIAHPPPPPTRSRPTRNVTRPSYRSSSPMSPLTPPPTESIVSSSPIAAVGPEPTYSASELRQLFETWHHLVDGGMEEYRFARFLNRKASAHLSGRLRSHVANPQCKTDRVSYWMNMYDAWLSGDGPFAPSTVEECSKRGRALSQEPKIEVDGAKKRRT